MTDAVGSALSGIGNAVGSAASGVGNFLSGGGGGIVATPTDILDATTNPIVNAVSTAAPVLSTAVPDFTSMLSGAANIGSAIAPAILQSNILDPATNPVVNAQPATLPSDFTTTLDTSGLTPTVSQAITAATGAPSAGSGLLGTVLKTAIPAVQTASTLKEQGQVGAQTAATEQALTDLAKTQGATQTATNTQTLGQNTTALQQQANQLGTQAAIQTQVLPQLLNELQGKLPEGAQASIDMNTKANIAAIKSKYAGMGMSGSTAEAQDIATAKQSALAQSFAVSQQLAQEGLSALTTTPYAGSVTQLGGDTATLLEELLRDETNQGSALGTALANFAAAATKTA